MEFSIPGLGVVRRPDLELALRAPAGCPDPHRQGGPARGRGPEPKLEPGASTVLDLELTPAEIEPPPTGFDPPKRHWNIDFRVELDVSLKRAVAPHLEPDGGSAIGL